MPRPRRASPTPRLALALATLLLAACPSPGPGPEPEERPSPSSQPATAASGAGSPSAGELLADLRLEAPQRSAGQGGARGRRVLLVVADRYEQREYDLERGDATIATLREALAQELQTAPEDVILLRGKDVVPRRVESALERATDGLAGADNLLLVYYYGHGLARADGLQLFGYDTHFSEGEARDTLPYSELRGWLVAARQRLQRAGGDLRLVSVVDACRVRTMGPARVAPRALPTPAQTLADLGGAEVFSAEEGQPALEGVFGSAFCAALSAAAQGERGERVERVELGAVLEATTRRLEQARASQRPTWQGSEGLVLYRRGGIPLRVELYDQSTGASLSGGVVRLNEQSAGAPASFGDLRPGSFFLQAQHPDCFWRDEDLEVRAADAGRVVRVGLLPRFDLVVGELHNPQGTRAAVELVGASTGRARSGYHQLRAEVQGSGRFALRAPALEGKLELVVRVGGTVLARRSLSQAGRDHLSHAAGAKRPLRVARYDFGRFELGQAAQARRLEDLGQAVALGAVVLPSDLTWRDEATRTVYERVQSQVQRGDLRSLKLGLSGLANLAAQEGVGDARTQETLRALEPRLRLYYLTRLRAQDPAEGRDLLGGALRIRGGRALAGITSEARETLVRWLNADASAAEEAGQLPRALALLEEALATGPDPAARQVLEARVSALWVARVEGARARALQDDSWEAVARELEQATPRLPEAVSRPLRERLERERMPRVAREALAAGHARYDAGELEQAEAAYRRALPGLTPYYRAQAEAQLADLAQRLFVKYYALADDLDAAGEGEGALRAYLRAWRYEPELVAGVWPAFLASEPRWRAVYEAAAPTPPTLRILSPAAPRVTLGPTKLLGVEVAVESGLPLEVEVEGQRLRLRGGRGRLELSLPLGRHTLRARARDLLGRSVEAQLSLELVGE